MQPHVTVFSYKTSTRPIRSSRVLFTEQKMKATVVVAVIVLVLVIVMITLLKADYFNIHTFQSLITAWSAPANRSAVTF